MLKKIFAVAVLFIGISAVSVSAKDALYSDIDTYINHYPINAYAVDGKLAVVAEDLRDYGFNVIWDDWAKELHISRNEWVTQLVRKDVYDPAQPSGTKFSTIYPSDIKVYYNGTQLTSYALNGYTLIPINDFARLAGSETWVPDVRAYKVWIDGLSVCEYYPLTQRCRNLWYNEGYNEMPMIDFWEDMDSDGQFARVILLYKDYSGVGPGSLIIRIGSLGYNIINESAYGVSAVYLVDMFPNDHAKEIIVFLGWSANTKVIVYRYSDGKLDVVPFDFDYHEGYYNNVNDAIFTGTSDSSLILNDDGSFTIATSAPSDHWDVYTTFIENEYGYLEKIDQDTYTVCDMSQYTDSSPWGYYYVKKTCTGRGLTLYKGDWIKVLEDDMQGHILILKNNGQQGWFRVGWDCYIDEELNEVSDLFWSI